MRVVERWALRHFSRIARPYLKSYGFLRTPKIFNRSALVWRPRGENIVVLAPHMDDEVIGCGGALYQHIRNGADVTVVFLTDGRAGSRKLAHISGEERKQHQRTLIEVRKKEARRAAIMLGIKETIFLDAEEANLTSTWEIQQKVRRILDVLCPDLVYLPFFLEEHPDHRAVSRILLDATVDTSLRFECVGFEIWTPLFPNCLVEITDVIDVKKRAIECYESQLADADYLHTCLGLNAFRASALLDNKDGYVEAFFRVTLDVYRGLYQSYSQDGASEQ
jgi:N-acetylglucosamine malate deacetylase 1